ncbi:hypothetical protein [Pedobacter sp.]|jgi:hypothetical protein|uniref:hypothetical protein n=1 Tax=Pedobacter sp. TaxID=1411316 RepID=UPI002BF67E56|nr:hypothetical protein [Pedobacter sp.]HWW43175.1 hypothetical protein [Pedobacter sp.]
MARLDGKFIKGTAGSVVYKRYLDLQVVQSRPKFTPGSQTKETKRAAAEFGVASKLSMNVRHNLSSIVTDFFDGRMVNRMNSEVVYILNQAMDPQTGIYKFKPDSFNRLNGFEFNINSPVRDNFFAQPLLSATETTLDIKIPNLHLPQEMKFPKDESLCKLSFAVGLFDLIHGHMKLSPIQSIEIKYNYSPELIPEQTLNFEIEPGCLCITVISMQYCRNTFIGQVLANTKSFNPVAILGAHIAEGTVDEQRTKKWRSMDFSTEG